MTFAAIAGMVTLLYLASPSILLKLFKAMAGKGGFSNSSVEVRHIGATKFDLANIFLGGDEDRPTFSIETLRADFTPFGLMEKRVDRIIVSGLRINASFKNGKFSLRGWSPDMLPTGSAPSPAEPGRGSLAQGAEKYFNFYLFEARNSLLSIETDKGLCQIPFTLTAFPGRKGMEHIYFALNLFPRDQRVSFKGHVVPDLMRVTFDTKIGSLDLDKFQDILRSCPGIEAVYGVVKLSSQATINASGLDELKIECSVDGLEVQSDQLNARALPEGFQLKAHKKSGNPSFEIEASGLAFKTPAAFNVAALKCELRSDGGATSAKGGLSLALEDQIIPGSNLAIRAQKPFDIKFDARLTPEGRNLKADVTTPAAVSIISNDYEAVLDNLAAIISEEPTSDTEKACSRTAKLSGKLRSFAHSNLRVDTGDVGFEISASMPADGIRAEARIATSGTPCDLRGSLAGTTLLMKKSSLECLGKMTAKKLDLSDATGSLRLKIKASPAFDLGDGPASFSATTASVDAETAFDLLACPMAKIKGKFVIEDGSVAGQGTSTHVPKIDVDASIGLDRDLSAKGSVAYRLELDKLAFANKASCAAGSVSGAVELAMPSKGKPAFSGRVDLGLTELSSGELTAASVKADIPWRLPFTTQEPDGNAVKSKGSLELKSVKYSKADLGDVAAGLSQKDDTNLAFSIKKSLDYPDLTATVDGVAGWKTDRGFRAGADFTLHKTDNSSLWSLGELSEGLKGLTFGGGVSLSGDLSYGRRGLKGSLKGNVKDGSIANHALNLAITGIEIKNLSIDDLIVFKSDRNRMRIAKVAFGNFLATDLNVVYEIESPSSYFLENCSFKWCGGDAYTPAARFRPSEKSFNIVLYCTQLNLVEVMKQFYEMEAEGQGQLSGRIPVRWRNNSLMVDKGYLYSTPGEGGDLKVDCDSASTTSAVVGASIAAALSESNTGFAKDALKDFHYDWAKVTINSDQDVLRAKFLISGSPNKPVQIKYGANMQFARPPMKFEFNVNTFSVNEIIHQAIGFNLNNLIKPKQ